MAYPYYSLSMNTGDNGYGKGNAPSGLLLDGSSEFTITAWISFSNTGGFKNIVSREQGLLFGIRDQFPAFHLPGYSLVTAGKKVTVDEWHFVCIAYDKSMFWFYLDGQQAGSSPAYGTPVACSSPLVFGKNLRGQIRNVTIYPKALSLSDIKSHQWDTSGALGVYDFTRQPPKETVSGNTLEMKSGAVIMKSAQAAIFKEYGFLEVDSGTKVNPAGICGRPYTVQAWIYLDPVKESECYTILTNTDFLNTSGMTLSIEKTDSSYHLCFIHGIFENMANRLISVNSISKQVWTNVAVTFENSVARLYINGVLDTEKSGLLPMVEGLIQRNCYIGSDADAGSGNGIDVFHGAMSRLDVWERALSQTELLTYLDVEPDFDGSELCASYCFQDTFVNKVDFTPLGRKRGMNIGVVEAVCVETEMERQSLVGTPDDEWMDFGEVPIEHRLETIARLRECAENHADEQVNLDSGFYTVSHFKKDGFVYFAEHDAQSSRIIMRVEEDALEDDVTVWIIQLIIIIVGGIGNLIFGLKLQSSGKLSKYLTQNVTCLYVLKSVFSGTSLTVSSVITGIVTVVSMLYSSNKLKELLKIAFQLGFWALIRICTKFVFQFIGGWAYWAVELGSLAVSIIAHVATYPSGSTGIPTVGIREIDFQERGADKGAIPVCQGSSMISLAPEWRSSPSILSAPVIYNMADILSGGMSHPICIWGTFSSENPDKGIVWIQAIDDSALKVLGDSDLVELNLSSLKTTYSGFMKFSFSSHLLSTQKIKKYELKLKWRCSRDKKNWRDIATTIHPVYTLLKSPGEPWTNRLPWVSILEVTYPWVADKTTADEIAAAVTTKVNGGLHLKYDAVGGAVHYTLPYRSAFSMTLLLDDIAKATASSVYEVNCVDCANAVTIIANLWGCSLSARRMYHKTNVSSGFACNQIVAIGYNDGKDWKKPFYGGFNFHAVSVNNRGSKNSENFIYDACLKVNKGTLPWSSTKSAQLPIGMPFSSIDGYPAPNYKSVDADSYREHLADNTSGGAPVCKLYSASTTAICI